MKKTVLFFLLITVMATFALAQNTSFTGTFGNYQMSLQLKAEGNEYHGLLSAAGASFALKGKVEGQSLVGKIYGLQGPVDFSAQMLNGMLAVTSNGSVETLAKISTQHQIQGVDLTPYMVDFSQGTQQQQGQDYDHSYSAHNEGYASGQSNSYPGQSRPSSNNPYQPLNDPELLNIIKGSQLVYYTRTSYVNDNTASSITYVNFCPQGTFTVNYDGSFMVE